MSVESEIPFVSVLLCPEPSHLAPTLEPAPRETPFMTLIDLFSDSLTF